MSKKILIKRIFSETITIVIETHDTSVSQEDNTPKRVKSRYSRPCKYIKVNRPCRFGEKCYFAHHYSEL